VVANIDCILLSMRIDSFYFPFFYVMNLDCDLFDLID